MSMCGMVSELMVGGRRGRRPNSRAGGMSKFEKKRWSKEEDERLLNHINRYGVTTKWDKVPRLCGLYPRSGKSCRSRWLDYLRPDLIKAPLTEEEGLRVIQLQQILGNKWAWIAKSLPGRTTNNVKNYWNTMRKKQHLNNIHTLSYDSAINLSIQGFAPLQNPSYVPIQGYAQSQNPSYVPIQGCAPSQNPSHVPIMETMFLNKIHTLSNDSELRMLDEGLASIQNSHCAPKDLQCHTPTTMERQWHHSSSAINQNVNDQYVAANTLYDEPLYLNDMMDDVFQGWCNDPNPPIPLSCSSTSVFGDSIPSTGGSPLYDEDNHDISLLSQDHNAAILYSPDHLMFDQMFDHNNSGWPVQDVDESLEDHTTTNESG